MAVGKFTYKVAKFILILFIVLEVLGRVVIDPLYFNLNNYYNPKPNSITGYYKGYYGNTYPKKVDYLFIGSSRTRAAINPDVFVSDSTFALNVGRGFSNGALNYLGIKYMLKQNPDVLKGARIVIEIPEGGTAFTENYAENKYTVDDRAPHLFVPFINLNNVDDFWAESENTTAVKTKVLGLYVSSFYRSIFFFRDYKAQMINKVISKIKKTEKDLENGGGIRNDEKGVELNKQETIKLANQQLAEQKTAQHLTFAQLDASVLAEINKLAQMSGAKVYLYQTPLHSISKQVFLTDFAKKDFELFSTWAKQNNITILPVTGFNYTDNDFPDLMHLGKSVQDYYSISLLDELKTNNN